MPGKTRPEPTVRIAVRDLYDALIRRDGAARDRLRQIAIDEYPQVLKHPRTEAEWADWQRARRRAGSRLPAHLARLLHEE